MKIIAFLITLLVLVSYNGYAQSPQHRVAAKKITADTSQGNKAMG